MDHSYLGLKAESYIPNVSKRKKESKKEIYLLWGLQQVINTILGI